MTDRENPFPARPDVIQRIAAVVTLEALQRRIHNWVARRFRIGTYELRDGQIISGRGRQAEDRIWINDVKAWHLHYEMVFNVVIIELADGRAVKWLDEFDDLLGILRTVAPDRKLP
jgi:hypothetical protein